MSWSAVAFYRFSEDWRTLEARGVFRRLVGKSYVFKVTGLPQHQNSKSIQTLP